MTSGTNRFSRFHEADHLSQALRGASFAFSSPSTLPERSQSSYDTSTGASSSASNAAWSKSARNGQLQATSTLQPRKPSGHIIDTAVDGNPPSSGQSRRGVTDTQKDSSNCNERYASREQSPSHVAAVMAASRTTPPREQPLQLPSHLKLTGLAHDASIDSSTDESPIAATKSLVNLYESIQSPQLRKAGVSHGNDRSSIRSSHPITPPSSKCPSVLHPQRYIQLPDDNKTHSGTVSPRQNVSKIGAVAAAAKLAKQARAEPRISMANSQPAPHPPSPRTSTRRPSALEQPQRALSKVRSSSPTLTSSLASDINKLSNPGLCDGGVKTFKPYVSQSSYSANLQVRECSPPRPVYNKASRSFDGPTYSATSTSLRPPTLSTVSLSPRLSADSLANAMVASSLASSRAPSPTKPHRPLPRRHGKPHSLFRRSQSTDEVNRTPSPAKQMRQTLRTAKRSEGEEHVLNADKKKSHFMKKHPNKHHEGDRKRWRDTVSEMERKRYEGLWAANKNLLGSRPPFQQQPSIAANTVPDIVVRDIWRRSRLSSDVLEEIWNLVTVDRVEARALGKEEFVVGMWLIDQRLKGRKLPSRVSESVWESVRMLSGIKAPKQRK